MKKEVALLLLIVGVALVFVFSLNGYGEEEPVSVIDSFEACAAAGYPVMESYPRQCRAGEGGKTFVEVIDELPFEEPEPMPIPYEEREYFACSPEEKQAEICTLEYSPMCGFVDNGIQCVTAPCPSVDAVTFGNRCGTCAGQAHGYYYGSCDDIAFVVCQETVTGFSAEEYARQVNGVCVDICPGNYDSYVTQIGVEVCIKHYGLTEIESWETCTQSTDSCNCVNAYETTTPDAIEDSVYRCVPEDYADRLIFRSGLDRLDENGERSIAIA